MAADLAAAVLDALPDATAVIDMTGRIIAVNAAWTMFCLDNGGDSAATGPGVNYLDVTRRAGMAGNGQARAMTRQIEAVLSGDAVDGELEYACPSPAANRWFLARVTRLSGPIAGAVVSHMNITRRKAAEDVLHHTAAHDPLTGLANRVFFAERLATALTPRQGRPTGHDVGVIYLDLDGFKSVNDTYGHAAGDEVLLTAAARLRSVIRPQDSVARLGGDEFAVLAPRITAAGLRSLHGRVSQTLAMPHRVHGTGCHIPASVGSYLAGPGESGTDVLGQADLAMYADKRDRIERQQ